MPRISGVRIDNVDSTLSSAGGRILTVKVGSHSFQTPTRPFTTAEIGAKSFLGYRGEISSDVATLPVDFSGKRKEYFLKNNGVLHKASHMLQNHVDSAFSVPSIPVIQLDPLPAEDRSSFKIAYDMQMATEGLMVLSMPEVSTGKAGFERCLKNWCDSADSDGYGVAVHLSLKDEVDTFADKLDVISEYSKTGCVTAVNIRYANPSVCVQQIAELWERREELETIVNCSEMMRGRSELAPGLKEDEETYLLQRGFDMITKKKITPSPKFMAYLSKNDPCSPDAIDSFNVMEHDASASIHSSSWLKMVHPPECSCTVCRGDTRERLVERFNYLDNGDVSKSGLRYFSVLHDHQSDMVELNVFREYTASNGTKEYNERIEYRQKELIGKIK